MSDHRSSAQVFAAMGLQVQPLTDEQRKKLDRPAPNWAIQLGAITRRLTAMPVDCSRPSDKQIIAAFITGRKPCQTS